MISNVALGRQEAASLLGHIPARDFSALLYNFFNYLRLMFKCLIYSQLAQCRLSEEKKCGIDCFIILRFNDFLSFMVCFVCVWVAVPSFNARVCVCSPAWIGHTRVKLFYLPLKVII